MNITNRNTIFEGFLKVDELIISHNGKTFKREQVNRGNAVAAIVYDTKKEKFIFVKQFRVGSESNLIEIVAGSLDKDGEDPEKAITREIEEEIGYSVDSIKYLTEFYSSPGSCTEKVKLYYAEVSNKIGKGGGLDEEHENIEIIEIGKCGLIESLLSDAKSILAVLWIKNNKVGKSFKNG